MHISASSTENLAQTMGQSFEILAKMRVLKDPLAIKMKKSVGFRNIAVHNYDELDLNITYEIGKNHLGDFVEFICQIQRYIENTTRSST